MAIFNLFKKKEEPKPAEPQKKIITKYLWLIDEEGIGNKFFHAYKDDLSENDEYSQTKKEIMDGYYDNGEKIYKYEPFELPFKIDDDKVYSYIDEDKWIPVGTLKKSDKGKLKRSTETELYLMPNYYKRVIYDDIETEHGDAYFGLEVTLEVTPKQ